MEPVRSFEQFEQKANIVHNNKYQYPDRVYIDTRTPINIYCPQCKTLFKLIPNNHLNGRGCKQCNKITHQQKQMKFFDQFEQKARKIHNNKYQYPERIYINAKTKIKIYCTECNIHFYQRPFEHLNGAGCKKCANKKLSLLKRKSFFDFEKQANVVHNNKYQYPDKKYEGAHIKLKIFCPKCCKNFFQTPDSHVNQEVGCPTCGATTSKNELLCKELLKEKLPDYTIISNDKTFMKKLCGRALEIDIIISKDDKNILFIEWNGEYYHKKEKAIKKDKFKKRILGKSLIQILDKGGKNISFVHKMVNNKIIPKLLKILNS